MKNQKEALEPTCARECSPCVPLGSSRQAPFPKRKWHALALGFCITVGQVILACCISGQLNPRSAYLHLVQWDGGWYAQIVEHGYLSPARLTSSNFGNVAFFPGYPVSARLVQWLCHIRLEYALLVASQVACWGFWTYLLLFFRRWRVGPGLAALGIALVLIHPAAFFLEIHNNLARGPLALGPVFQVDDAGAGVRAAPFGQDLVTGY